MVTRKSIRPRNTGATRSSARLEKGPPRSSASSSRVSCCDLFSYKRRKKILTTKATKRHKKHSASGNSLFESFVLFVAKNEMVANNNLSERVSNGEAAAVARAISKIEDNADGAAALMKEIYQRSRGALIIGITGAPGAGKSSLVDKLAMFYRKNGERVGIVAVDPSSPFSGGAILGDRIRMQALGLDEGVFIRSMATRGNLGGLARATVDAVAILDAAGYAKIIIETVGVGQDEVEVVKAADVSVVVLVPGMGDDIQAIKAGIMEIGDIFVINKADKEGVYATEKELESLLSLASRED